MSKTLNEPLQLEELAKLYRKKMVIVRNLRNALVASLNRPACNKCSPYRETLRAKIIAIEVELKEIEAMVPQTSANTWPKATK
jgi:hypothetical protein